jgi:hypothetical protein
LVQQTADEFGSLLRLTDIAQDQVPADCVAAILAASALVIAAERSYLRAKANDEGLIEAGPGEGLAKVGPEGNRRARQSA